MATGLRHGNRAQHVGGSPVPFGLVAVQQSRWRPAASFQTEVAAASFQTEVAKAQGTRRQQG
jgi:hypothetical protein